LSLFAVTAFAVPVMGPPERRITVLGNGDVLEWQPGLGIVVVSSGRAVTRVSRRRVSSSDGKTIVEKERATIHVERPTNVERPIDVERPRPKQHPEDAGDSLIEEMKRVN
jgi:hypothetical protein